MLKPTSCSSCPLYTKGISYAEPEGPVSSRILVVGEALGDNESRESRNFIGPAGNLLDRVLEYNGISRDEVRVTNCVRCQPTTGNWLVGAPWFHGALDNCGKYLQQTITETNPKVIIAVGAVAARELLGLRTTKASIYDLHGAPMLDKSGKYWVVSTFHTSFIIQSNWNLYGTLLYDISVAKGIADNGHTQDTPNLIIDPGWAVFDSWANEVLARAAKEQDGLWLAVDIETPGKRKKADETEWIGNVSEIENIDRINFAVDPAEAITVPFDHAHLDSIKKLLSSTNLKKCFWYQVFDRKHLKESGCAPVEPCWDGMLGFHILQSNIRMGLGFVAPFFSSYGPWKHLTDHNKPITSLNTIELNNYKEYSAIDGIQTIRCIYGIERDLKKQGQWDIPFARHMRDLDRFALRPAEEIGLLVDRGDAKKGTGLEGFAAALVEEADSIITECVKHAPQEIVPYAKTWRTARPAIDAKGNLLPGHKEIRSTEFIYSCSNCGLDDVTKAHAKTKKCAGVSLEFSEREVTRWVKEGVFNPNSPKQILAYIKYRGHKPGKQKKSKKDSSDVQALERLAKTQPKDPIYKSLIHLRKVMKMKGTYGTGILERLDADSRLHSSFTHTTATGRLGSRSPNLTNLVSKDKKEDENKYGARFRECIIAAPGCKLLEVDFGGVEAVQTGWWARDPQYLRLAKLGVHSYLCSHIVGEPADLSLSDEDLQKYFKYIKGKYFLDYNRAKRCTHGCCDPEHEVLTENGWIKFKDYNGTSPIAIWHKNRSITFEAPLKYWIYDYTGDMYEFNQTGMKQLITPNHKLPYYAGGDPEEYKLHSGSVIDLIERKYTYIPTTGTLKGGNPEDLYWLSLAVAIQADGSCRKSSVTFHLVKPRKIDRLELLLNKCGVVYKKWACTDHTNGFHIRFSYNNVFESMAWLEGKDKKFIASKFISASLETRKHFLAEVVLWDGTAKGKGNSSLYFTTNKHNAEIVQMVAHISGTQSLVTISTGRPGGRKDFYRVSFNRRYLAGLPTPKVSSYKGKVFCVTTSSGFFLTKYNNTVSITGNSNYLMTPKGMHLTYPDVFTTIKAAKEVQDIYFTVASKVRQWQLDTIAKADQQGYLGGSDHPYRYKMWFWDVISYKKVSHSQAMALRNKGQQVKASKYGTWYHITMGTDAKSAVAFYPQSTAGGNLKEAMLALTDPDSEFYIGDCYYGKTPFRIPIHDSLVFEVPDNKVDYVMERVVTVMRSPIKEQPLPSEWGMGEYLQIDVSAEVGRTWGSMETIEV